MSVTEFKNTSPIAEKVEIEGHEPNAHALLLLSLRYDPYSPTAQEDYEALRVAVQQFDILGLLRKEVAKSQIDVATTRQIIKTLRFLPDTMRDQAALSVCGSLENLYPIFPTVMLVLKSIWADLSVDTRSKRGDYVRTLFSEDSRLIKTRVNQAYACRLLSCEEKAENIELFSKLFTSTPSAMIIKSRPVQFGRHIFSESYIFPEFLKFIELGGTI